MSTTPETLFLKPDPQMPNNRWPVLLYRNALPVPATDTGAEFGALFTKNGWRGVWRNGVYPYNHFHPGSHEVLGVATGQATLQIGGNTGQPVTVRAGDAVLLPAGTGHKRLDASYDFAIIGAYPPGQEKAEVVKHKTAASEAEVATVPRPGTDPVNGEVEPLLRLWP